MSENSTNNRKKTRPRTVMAFVSLLAFCVLGGLVFGVVENIRDGFDRAH